MTVLVFVLALLFGTLTAPVYAQEVKPLYQLPNKLTEKTVKDTESEASMFIVGSEQGLYRVTNNNIVFPLWTEGSVEQIVRVDLPQLGNLSTSGWYMRTSKGLFYTSDFKKFDERNEGLPFLTVKKYDGEHAVLVKQIQDLKDICVNPLNPLEIVTATKDNVFYSVDGGVNWKNIGSMSKSTSGVKAVAVATIDNQTVVFMSHPIFGLSYILPNSKNPQWTDIDKGFEKMQSLTSPDEISDILPVVRTASDGKKYTELYISQTYLSTVYRFDWETKEPVLIYEGDDPVNTIDGLTIIDNVLVYTKLEGFGSVDINSFQSPGTPVKEQDWRNAFAVVPGMINAAWVPQSRSGFAKGLMLNELWMLYPGTINSPYAEKANGKKCIYASAYQCRNQDGIDKYKKIIKDRNMNGIVIDMKDDYGLLRYDSKDEFVLEKATVTQFAVDLDHFINEFKSENIYLVARIVTFKDRNLTKYQNGKYAIWDAKLKRPWMGIKGYEDIVDEEGNVTGTETTYYDENWVDPYSEEVWEYNVAVAKELIARGFDEIQFDYIRFPTDGLNLYNAQCRWKNEGMDKESALISFLSYARENIKAPIGIDIYGANGWYRSGTRTGQDAEMLCHYVDVIGPMFYPSHFEQTFLNYPPAADRTYRIYYYGSMRNTIMCRNKSIIRPWIQSFYLNCSYDRLYYDSDYIKKEFFGVRDSIDRGYMCWNNAGDYTTTPPDVSDTEPFIGSAYEASEKFKKPAIGNALKPMFVDTGSGDLSILDSILNQYENDSYKTSGFLPFLQVAPLNQKD